ncbi:MAG: protein phosphatase 2C domain-containing protein [Pseudomonadota bacterium]
MCIIEPLKADKVAIAVSFRWWSGHSSDCGRRRKVNEDALLSLPERGIWVVADGMGGHSRGDRASQLVIEAISQVPVCHSIDELVTRVRESLHLANKNVLAESQSLGEGKIMGSTVVVLLIHDNDCACLWAGDSRVYRLREGKLKALTKDHSVVQQMVDAGEIKPEEARGHPASNRITRAVGARERLAVDEIRGHLRDGDTFLLCSDGLIIEVEEEELAALLEGGDSQAIAQEMMDLTLLRGARDNVTLQIVQIEETTGVQLHTADRTAINYTFRKRLVQGVRTVAN